MTDEQFKRLARKAALDRKSANEEIVRRANQHAMANGVRSDETPKPPGNATDRVREIEVEANIVNPIHN